MGGFGPLLHLACGEKKSVRNSLLPLSSPLHLQVLTKVVSSGHLSQRDVANTPPWLDLLLGFLIDL